MAICIELANFAPHVIVSASRGLVRGNGWLHFVEEKAYVNAGYYANKRLSFGEDNRELL